MIEAWAAGIIDGEGTIGIYKIDKSKKAKIGIVQVTNTDFRIIKTLQDNFDGRIYETKRKNRPRSKRCWIWRIAGVKTILFLSKIKIYLISKKDKADELINFYNQKANH